VLGRLTPLAMVAGVCLLPPTGSSEASEREPRPVPNFVLIVTDDQGWWDLGIHGSEKLDTPVMDRLAGEGVELTRFYVEPVCAPTRAGLMTGRYYLRTGLYNTRFGGDTMGAEEITIAEVLREHGYRTGVFGKWHLGRYAPYGPNAQGFDEALTFSHGHIERYDHPSQLSHNGTPVQVRGYITDVLTDAAIQFVESNRDRPFFCYLPYNVPHEPMVLGHAVHLQERGEALLSKYIERGLPVRVAHIYGMIERCDENIGRLLETIDAPGLREKTVLFFMSDNGGIHRFYKAGLRGHKGSVYEGGVRSPFLARWPGHFPAGAKVDAMASHVDLLPTICEIVGAPPPSDRPIDGRSIVDLLTKGKGTSPHEYVYHTWNRYFPRDDNRWAIGGQRYKLADGRLFDLLEDPGEKTDIAKAHPERVQQMRAEFVRWFNDVTAGQVYEPVPIPVGRPEENPVELQASWATLEGEHVHYTFLGYDWDTIDGWREPGESARWKIDVARPGTYEVTVSYGAAPASAGSRFRITGGDRSLEGVVEATVTPDVFIRRTLGTLDLSTGPATLACEPAEVNGAELMRLNRIWLKRLHTTVHTKLNRR
jgi:arylsulfatase A